MYFEYTKAEVDYLGQRDEKLKKAMDGIGMIKREMIPGFFEALMNSIVSQQISSGAFKTVWQRMKSEISDMSADNVANMNEEYLCGFGISGRKANYIISAARELKNVDIDRLCLLGNEEFVKELCKLKGVGCWTAHMMMIFSLGRKDVFAVDDYGVKKGLMTLHGLQDVSKDKAREFAELYSPYGSVACLYLWEIASRNGKLRMEN